jgi:hypothetical protein
MTTVKSRFIVPVIFIFPHYRLFSLIQKCVCTIFLRIYCFPIFVFSIFHLLQKGLIKVVYYVKGNVTQMVIIIDSSTFKILRFLKNNPNSDVQKYDIHDICRASHSKLRLKNRLL